MENSASQAPEAPCPPGPKKCVSPALHLNLTQALQKPSPPGVFYSLLPRPPVVSNPDFATRSKFARLRSLAGRTKPISIRYSEPFSSLRPVQHGFTRTRLACPNFLTAPVCVRRGQIVGPKPRTRPVCPPKDRARRDGKDCGVALVAPAERQGPPDPETDALTTIPTPHCQANRR